MLPVRCALPGVPPFRSRPVAALFGRACLLSVFALPSPPSNLLPLRPPRPRFEWPGRRPRGCRLGASHGVTRRPGAAGRAGAGPPLLRNGRPQSPWRGVNLDAFTPDGARIDISDRRPKPPPDFTRCSGQSRSHSPQSRFTLRLDYPQAHPKRRNLQNPAETDKAQSKKCHAGPGGVCPRMTQMAQIGRKDSPAKAQRRKGPNGAGSSRLNRAAS